MTKARVNADNASADIQGVTAGDGITGGGSSGVVTVAVSSDVLRSTGGQVISANTSSTALEIRQTGAGNALVIEDNTNPDSTPFVVNTDGLLWIGNQTDLAGVTERGVIVTDENTTGAVFVGRKSSSSSLTNAAVILAKSNGTAASPTVVASGEYLGNVSFHGFDGTNYSPAVQILGVVDGTPGTGDMPGRIVFLTSADGTASPVERMRISADGTTTINAIADATTTTAARGGGYMGIPQSAAATTGSYTIVAADAGEHIYTTATRTVTIPANASVAFPVGTAITFVAATGATVTIAITSDTLLLAGPGTTGSRTLAPFGMATALKITSTSWIISGNGLT